MAWLPLNGFELAAALLSGIGVFLSVRQVVWNWPFGIVSVLMYAWIFFHARLYADAGLQLFYATISVYGWWHWVVGGRRAAAGTALPAVLPVTRLPRAWWPAVVGGTALAGWGVGHLLATQTDAAIPYLDAMLTATSLAAQWMLTRKYVENWILWIVVDAVYVPTYFARGLPVTAVLYAVFLGLAVMGWREWRGALPSARDGAPVPAAP